MSIDEGGRAGTAEIALILTTVADMATARNVAAVLLEERVVACVQLSRIDSLYLWGGEIVEEGEVRLLIKTPAALRGAAMARVAAHHPYGVPQIVALDASAVHEPYLAWAREATR